jgi:hypothetical protein
MKKCITIDHLYRRSIETKLLNFLFVVQKLSSYKLAGTKILKLNTENGKYRHSLDYTALYIRKITRLSSNLLPLPFSSHYLLDYNSSATSRLLPIFDDIS